MSESSSRSVRDLLLNGLGGVIVKKNARHLEVISAIHDAAFSSTELGTSIAGQGVDISQFEIVQPLLSAREMFQELTDREFEVLEWLARKQRNREIAVGLGIKEKTVRNHISNILWKLSAKDRNAIIFKARRAGLGQVMLRQEVVLQTVNYSLEPVVTNMPTTQSEQIPVGCEREWLALETAWNAGLFTYIAGAAGVGKSFLMQAFAASRGGQFIEFNGRPGDAAIPYASYARSIRQLMLRFPKVKHEAWVMKELERIVPSLGSNSVISDRRNNGIEATIRLCDALATFHVNLAPQMTGMLFDDIEYFDQASAEASIYMISSWERFTGKIGEAQHCIACFQTGRLKPEIEQGIRLQAQAGTVALIEL
jgi:DNA-binding CsgD family transcriptional regulator